MAFRALIPVKALSEAKSRLSPYLTPERRAQLVLTMLEHVIHVLHTQPALEQVAVVSADPRVLAQVSQWGAVPYLEEQHGHNPALQAAALHELLAGVTTLLTISADLPLLAGDDIQRMLNLSRRYDVVLASSEDGTGTNALLTSPPLAVPFLFGPGSLQRYLAEAAKRQLSTTRYSSIGTSLDIDTIDDLAVLDHSTSEGEAAPLSYQV